MKSKFPQQTRDSIETLWYEPILQRFPSYGKFWEEFIGIKDNHNKGGILEPYSIVGSNIAHISSKDLRELHWQICMAHYSCFCHLAFAHDMSQKLSKMTNNISYQEFFDHWRTFEAGYLHLGVAWQEMKLLWKLILERFAKKEPNRNEWIFGMYFRRLNSNPQVLQKVDDMQHKVIDFRDKIAHVSRRGSILRNGTFEIGVQAWTQKVWPRQVRFKKGITTIDRLKQDIALCEETFEVLHQNLISEFFKALKANSVTIDHGTGAIDVFCPKEGCGWWSIPWNVQISSGNLAPLSGSIPSFSCAASGMASVPAGSSALQISLINGNTSPAKTTKRKCQNPKCGNIF